MEPEVEKDRIRIGELQRWNLLQSGEQSTSRKLRDYRTRIGDRRQQSGVRVRDVQRQSVSPSGIDIRRLQDVMLSQSLDDLGTTRGECLGRTRWSSSLDWTTYLYYFYKWLYTTSPQSHVLLECSTITWPHCMIWLLKFPCYLYLVFIICLDICDQVFECRETFSFLGLS